VGNAMAECLLTDNILARYILKLIASVVVQENSFIHLQIARRADGF
jgi:hypothetical protein